MAERPKFFDDLAGVAGGAISALGGLRQEAESLIRSWIDDTIRRLDLVKREEFDAIQQVAAAAREGQEKSEQLVNQVLARITALEAKVAELEAARHQRGESP